MRRMNGDVDSKGGSRGPLKPRNKVGYRVWPASVGGNLPFQLVWVGPDDPWWGSR